MKGGVVGGWRTYVHGHSLLGEDQHLHQTDNHR